MELVREVDMWLSEFRAVFRRQCARWVELLGRKAPVLHLEGSLCMWWTDWWRPRQARRCRE
jgi:hypothetical protein